MTWTSLPVLDLAQLAGSETEQIEFLTRLRESARDVGFFYLINHGINPQLQQNVQSITRAFFDLPQEEKLRVSMIHSPHFRGYNLAGVDTPASSETSASSSISARIASRCCCSRTMRRGSACRDRTSGRRRCRSCVR